MASRGMGAISSSKMPKGVRKERRDSTDFTEYAEGGEVDAGSDRFKYSKMPKQDLASALAKAQSTGNKSLEKTLLAEQGMRKSTFGAYAKGGEVWDNPRPKEIGKPKALTPAKKSAAKKAAAAAGRPYPNLVDNMRASRK